MNAQGRNDKVADPSDLKGGDGQEISATECGWAACDRSGSECEK